MSETIQGIESLNRKLGALSDHVLHNLGVPVQAGLMLISNQAKRNIQNTGDHPDATGVLAATIHEEVKVSGSGADGRSGTNAEYAKRHEFLPGHAIMRPAFDEKKGEAKQEVLDALQDLIAAAIQ